MPLELRLARLDGAAGRADRRGPPSAGDARRYERRSSPRRRRCGCAAHHRRDRVGIVIADARQPDQPIVYTNVAFERMTGWRFAEVVGRNCWLLQGRAPTQQVARLREAVRTGSDIEVLLLNYTREDGPSGTSCG